MQKLDALVERFLNFVPSDFSEYEKIFRFNSLYLKYFIAHYTSRGLEKNGREYKSEKIIIFIFRLLLLYLLGNH